MAAVCLAVICVGRSATRGVVVRRTGRRPSLDWARLLSVFLAAGVAAPLVSAGVLRIIAAITQGGGDPEIPASEARRGPTFHSPARGVRKASKVILLQ